MHVAVVIVGFRNPEDVFRCLDALSGSTHADFEVMICENGGAEAFAALQAGLAPALAGGRPVRAVLAPGNLGFAGGVNLGMRETAGADAWWVLNPDTLPAPDALEAMVERLQQGDCEAVGCTVELPDAVVQSHGGRWRAWLARPVSIGHGSPVAAAADPATIEQSQNYLNGASMLVGRRFLEVAGYMREDYFLYCEEVEWCLRAKALGLRLGYAPRARVFHNQGSTTGAGQAVKRRPRTPIYLSARNQILLTRDCYPQRLPVAALASLALSVLRFARGAAWPQLGYAVSGWAAGLRNERGVPAWLKP